MDQSEQPAEPPSRRRRSVPTGTDAPAPPGSSPTTATAAATPIALDVSGAGAQLSSGEAQTLRTLAARALAAVADRFGATGEVRARIVADDEMAQLHERHTGVAGTTDVLTFDLAETEHELDVDLVLCVDEARRRAHEYGHDVARELTLYLVHGVLHCLGHDDHDETDAQRMHTAEDELLEAAGIGRVFDPARDRGAAS